MNTMKTLILLIAAGLAMAAETPKAALREMPKPAPLKSATLSETEQLKVENIQLRLQLVKASEAELNKDLNAIFAAKCQAIGGASMADCNASGPSQMQPGYSVTLKPVPPVQVEAQKK